jgi:hypothetical protein
MTEISHFLKQGGWKVNRAKGVCTTMLPKKGVILIGYNETEGECCLAWVDGSKCLRIVERLQRQERSPEWKGTFKHEGQEYWITVKAKGRGIEGELGALHQKATTGTWGAEAGSGGGGGGGNAPPPPTKDKGNDVNAHS